MSDWPTAEERHARREEYKQAMTDPRREVVTKAIAEAMDWNIRAYGKIACEEDAEFFAAEVMIALRRAESRKRS